MFSIIAQSGCVYRCLPSPTTQCCRRRWRSGLSAWWSACCPATCRSSMTSIGASCKTCGAAWGRTGRRSHACPSLRRPAERSRGFSRITLLTGVLLVTKVSIPFLSGVMCLFFIIVCHGWQSVQNPVVELCQKPSSSVHVSLTITAMSLAHILRGLGLSSRPNGLELSSLSLFHVSSFIRLLALHQP